MRKSFPRQVMSYLDETGCFTTPGEQHAEKWYKLELQMREAKSVSVRGAQTAGSLGSRFMLQTSPGEHPGTMLFLNKSLMA